MSSPLRILILEDNPSDAELFLHELRQAGFDPDWQRVETEEDYLAALDPALELILSDYSLPQFDGLRALHLLNERGLDIPFIVVSGTIGEHIAVECLKQGAADYLLKDRLARLAPAVMNALEQKRLRDERRQAGAALRASEKRFRALIENSSDGIVLLSAEGTVLYDSPAVTQILGYAPDERVGRNVFEFIHPDERQTSIERFARFAQQPGAVVNSQGRFRHKDGSWRWIEGVRSNLLDQPGVQAIVVNYRDVTERKRAEQRLAAQYAVARCLAESDALADAAPPILQAICESLEWDQGEVWSVLWNADLQANVLRCVGTWHPPSASFPEFEAVTRQIEFAPGVGLPGRVWASGEPAWIPDVTQDANFPRAPMAAREGLRAGFAFPLKPDGGVFGVMGFFSREIRQPDNDLLQMFTSLSSQISQFIKRKRAEEALQASERQLSLIYGNVSDVLFYLAVEPEDRFRFLSVNSAFLKATGLTEDQIVGKLVQDVIPEPAHALVLGNYKEAIRTKKTVGWEEVSVYPAGKKYGEVSVTPIFDANGNCTHLIGTVHDITERKQAEAALAARNEEIKAMSQQLWQAAKLATMGELAASIAHELNNPLATVGLRVEDLLAEVPPDYPKRRALEVIEQEVERMGTLVSNLLQFSRRGSQQISTLDVRDEIAKTLELVHYLLRQRRIAVVQDFAPDAPMIQADRQQLRQLFLNLFTNASDAMPDGGTLTIRVGVVGKQVVIEVGDTGVGIAPDDLLKVLEPFFTTKPEGKGTGLGLAICRRIVQEHGGTLDIASAGSGQGATVRIVLLAKNNSNGSFLKEP